MAKGLTTSKTRARSKKIDNVDLEAYSNASTLSNIKIEIKHKNENQKKLTQSIKINDVTICTGNAGTGKTYVSCMQALNELKNNQNIKKIVLVKSVTTLKSEEIGFLKGNLEEKMEPFLYSFKGNFEKIIGNKLYTDLKNEKLIEILPIAYLRGVNIDNAIVIIDEVQNISIDNIRTILTRLGENSKMVFLGDIKQIDAKNKKDSALKFLIDNFKNINNIGIIEFTKDDIIRHPLIKIVEEVFDSLEKETVTLKKTKYKKVKLKKFTLIEKIKSFLANLSKK